jgi:hypothetical protein
MKWPWRRIKLTSEYSHRAFTLFPMLLMVIKPIPDKSAMVKKSCQNSSIHLTMTS